MKQKHTRHGVILCPYEQLHQDTKTIASVKAVCTVSFISTNYHST